MSSCVFSSIPGLFYFELFWVVRRLFIKKKKKKKEKTPIKKKKNQKKKNANGFFFLEESLEVTSDYIEYCVRPFVDET